MSSDAFEIAVVFQDVERVEGPVSSRSGALNYFAGDGFIYRDVFTVVSNCSVISRLPQLETLIHCKRLEVLQTNVFIAISEIDVLDFDIDELAIELIGGKLCKRVYLVIGGFRIIDGTRRVAYGAQTTVEFLTQCANPLLIGSAAHDELSKPLFKSLFEAR